MTVFDRLHTAIDSPGPAAPLFSRLAALDHTSRLPAIAREVRPVDRVNGPRPSVSIVIPCYNYARFLPGAVTSCLSQEGVDVEVVVVNDASTDDTAEVADRLAGADTRVSVVNNPHNVGHVRTFNNGLERTGGDYVVRLDADDLLTSGSLRRATALFAAYPDVGLVYGHPRHFTTPQPPAPVRGPVTWTVWPGREWIAERTRRGTNCITTPEAMIRASVLAEVGGLNTNLHYAQDMEMWLRTAVVSDVGRVNGAEQALHRDHPDSMSENEGAGRLNDLEERRQVFDEVFTWAAPRMSSAEGLAAQAHDVLAREALGAAVHLYDRGRYDQHEVEALTRFASSTCPGFRELPEWQRLEAIRRLGPRAAKYHPAAAVRVVKGRLQTEMQYLRWTRTGV